MPAGQRLNLEPKAGFEWRKVIWGRPDAIVSALCSYCSASFRVDEVPLMAFTQGDRRLPDGSCAKFCTKCQKEWFGLESFEEDE